MKAPGFGLTPATSLTLGDLRQFYAQTLARRTLVMTSVLLAYGGGAAMSGCTPSPGRAGTGH